MARQEWLAHPFSVTCGSGWARLIRVCLERMSKLAPELQTKIGISQIAERDGLLSIEIENVGMIPHWAKDFAQIADFGRAELALICEICGDTAMLRMIDDRKKTRCAGHAAHGDHGEQP